MVLPPYFIGANLGFGEAGMSLRRSESPRLQRLRIGREVPYTILNLEPDWGLFFALLYEKSLRCCGGFLVF